MVPSISLGPHWPRIGATQDDGSLVGLPPTLHLFPPAPAESAALQSPARSHKSPGKPARRPQEPPTPRPPVAATPYDLNRGPMGWSPSSMVFDAQKNCSNDRKAVDAIPPATHPSRILLIEPRPR